MAKVALASNNAIHPNFWGEHLDGLARALCFTRPYISSFRTFLVCLFFFLAA